MKTTCGKEFEVGMRVLVSGTQDEESFSGEQGTVVESYGRYVAIRFDTWWKGHGEDFAVWNFFESDRPGWTITDVGKETVDSPKPNHTFEDFKVGDRVRLTDDNGYCETGAEGTVVEGSYDPFVNVEFDKPFHGTRRWYCEKDGANLEKLGKPSRRFMTAWVCRGPEGEVTDLNSTGYEAFFSHAEADASALEALKDHPGVEIAVMEVRTFHRSKIEVVSEAA